MRFAAVSLIVLTSVVFAGTAAAAPALGFRPAGITATDTPTEAAVALIEQRPGLVDGADMDQLVVAAVDRSEKGITTVRFDQELHGVPVLGGEVVVAVDAKLRVIAAAGEAYDGVSPALGPSISAVEAQQIAIATIGKSLGEGLIASTPSLVVFDPATAGAPGGPSAVLTWNFELTRGDAVRQNVFVDASTGFVVQSMDAIETLLTRYVCDANDTTTKVPCDSGYARTEGQVATGNTDVDSAYDFSGATYDFYWGLLRNSIDGAGMPIISTVRYCPADACPNFANAFWDGTQMVYGTGYAVADDVVGHELTHGVTEHTSNLFYWYQSGAINEAMSDIMGEFIDLAHPGVGATEDTAGKRWLIGEDLPFGAIRNMKDPPAVFHDPDKITSTYYTTAFSDNGGVHTNSGVANKTAYLIADGGTFNGQTVTGIGLTKSAWLWYTTDTTLLYASGFADLADTLERTCTGLVNLGIDGFVSADCTQVSKAITATELRTPVVPVPAVCSTGVPAYAFNDGFDNGTSSWTIDSTVGSTNLWYASSAASPDGSAMTWPTTASKNVRGVDSAVRSDSTMAMNAGVVIPAGAYLRLNHWFGFEAGDTLNDGFDGGIIEYSSDGGAWTDIGSLTAVNGYNGALGTGVGYDNPIAGHSGFVGVSNGALATRYDLTSLAGHTVKFRFRVATDSSGGSYGWYIDDVQVYSCASVSNALVDTTPQVAPTAATPPALRMWTRNATTDVITARLVYKPGTVYSIKASNGRITRAGTCRQTDVTVTCSVKAPNGLWKIIVTPKTGAKTGKAIVRYART